MCLYPEFRRVELRYEYAQLRPMERAMCITEMSTLDRGKPSRLGYLIT